MGKIKRQQPAQHKKDGAPKSSKAARSASSKPLRDHAPPLVLENGFHFIPMGGSEQFGVNFNLYHCDGKWLAIDCGMGFADHRFPGIDILLPDPAFLDDKTQDLAGLVITHAHEDHIGAVPYIWPRLKCPIYCTPFTATVLRQKMHERAECKKVKIIEVEPDKSFDLGPFHLQFIPVSHSIPQAVATVIETSYGRVLHSGDWNLDPTPVIDLPTSADAFKKIGQKGVLAYVGDSTNAPIAGRGGSERDVLAGLEKVFAECTGRIAITIFASNIARVQSIIEAAAKVNRSVCILGRSLHRMTAAAKDNGYMRRLPNFIAEDDIGYVPSDKIVFIVTGSQGEAAAAMARISRGEWAGVRLGQGDVAIFSSRAIPGNEAEINQVKNNLSAAGVQIIDPDNTEHKIHVSGHPYRDEIIDMLSWVKPEVVIPVHGERLMLDAHADIARSLQVKTVIVPKNGSVIRLAPDDAMVIDHIPTGLLAVEPNRVVVAHHKAIAERRKLQFAGAAHITVVLDARGNLAVDPQISLMGLIDEDDKADQNLLRDILQEIEDVVLDLQDDGVQEKELIEEDIRVAVRRMLSHALGMKPKVSVHVIQVG